MENWSYECDTEPVRKLKVQYPEQFHNLVRMHLSLVSELNIDEVDESSEKKYSVAKWGFPLKKKPKLFKDSSIKEYTIEGTMLTDEGITRINQIIQFLSKEENICQEGIFRRTGAITRQIQLKNYLTNGVSVNLELNEYTVHDCASVLKTFLADLSEPLITDAFFPIYCQISEFYKLDETSHTKVLNSLQMMMMLLPNENLRMFKSVLQLLHLTANHVHLNKMSPQNLATLFTPHLMCPRKLNGEALHANVQIMSCILVFMIQVGEDIFKIPTSLAADIRLYWHEKEKRKLSPRNNILNESVTDGSLVRSAFSVVDRTRSAQENISNPTEAALAELYAHIQSLPESSRKRRLVKQFNKENGYGTPKQRRFLNNEKTQFKSRNLGDSIKKHLFQKVNRRGNVERHEKEEQFLLNNNSESKLKSHPLKRFEKSLDCRDCGCSDISDEAMTKSDSYKEDKSEPDVPILKSTEEILMTPSTPVNLRRSLSTDNLCLESMVTTTDSISFSPEIPFRTIRKSISTPNLDHYPDCSMQTPDSSEKNISPDQKFLTPYTPVFAKQLCQKFVSKNSACTRLVPLVSNNKTTSMAHFQCSLTSTPAPRRFSNDCPVTPSFFPIINDDMSPITMSAQKMSKAMQENIMTPRSRKPVIEFSSSNASQMKDKTLSINNCNCSYSDKTGHDESTPSHSEEFKTCFNSWKHSSSEQESLSKTFQDYLYSRSILTASPVDSSFSSRAGDFDPSSHSDSEKLSDSLLFCLDGNVPSDLSNNDVDKSNERKQTTYHNKNDNYIHETVL